MLERSSIRQLHVPEESFAFPAGNTREVSCAWKTGPHFSWRCRLGTTDDYTPGTSRRRSSSSTATSLPLCTVTVHSNFRQPSLRVEIRLKGGLVESGWADIFVLDKRVYVSLWAPSISVVECFRAVCLVAVGNIAGSFLQQNIFSHNQGCYGYSIFSIFYF